MNGKYLTLAADIADELENIQRVKETYRYLNEYRRFRHVVRNVYTFNLRGSRLKELAKGVGDCFTAVYTDLSIFIQFLQQLGADSI